MKIFNSIKWRLQIWYGLILVVVLAGFGFTAFQLERGRQMRRIDNELMSRADMIAGALRQPPRNGPPGEQRLRPLPPDDEREFNPPPRDNPPGRAAPQAPVNFRPPQAAYLFDESDPNGYYFVCWWRDGKEFARSTNAPAFIQKPDRQYSPEPQPPREHSDSREVVIFTPPGEIILVGRNITPELAELRLVELKLTGFGAIILFLGLTGGWWFVSRALRPIENISAAAVKISAGDLSQRINVAETESELGKLAAVLNSTFARLESAFAQQKQFASDAAHELRTPVTVILTQTQTALTREREAHDYKETIEACQRAAQRMKKLISSLLELARLDAGQTKLKRQQFDFSKTVEECIEQIKPIAEERGIKFSSKLEPLEINGDAMRLAQVVTNLLTNAIKYNKPDGNARVKLESQNGLAVLTVSDTGNGISAEDLPHVFKRFYRGDKSRTGANSSGLGLAICKAIVEAHGGTIEVESTEDVGTVFTVRLPV